MGAGAPAQRLGARATEKWLISLLFTFVLFYFLIDVLYVLALSVLLPGCLKEHYERYDDPLSQSEYPFKVLKSLSGNFLDL